MVIADTSHLYHAPPPQSRDRILTFTMEPPQPTAAPPVMATGTFECAPPNMFSANTLYPLHPQPRRRLDDDTEMLRATVADLTASIEEIWIKLHAKFDGIECKLVQLEHQLQEARDPDFQFDALSSKLKEKHTEAVRDVDFTCQIGSYLAKKALRNEYQSMVDELKELQDIPEDIDDLTRKMKEMTIQLTENARNQASRKDIVRNYQVSDKLMRSFHHFVQVQEDQTARRNSEIAILSRNYRKMQTEYDYLQGVVMELQQATDIEKEKTVEIVNDKEGKA